MSEAKHTPGLLVVSEEGSGFGIENSDGKPIAQAQKVMADTLYRGVKERQANARRLAACWNACEGLDTELLENILMLGDTLKSRFAARDQIEKELQAQHDDLLEALKLITKVYAGVRETLASRYPGDGWSKDSMSIDQAHAAIAKVTRGDS